MPLIKHCKYVYLTMGYILGVENTLYTFYILVKYHLKTSPAIILLPLSVFQLISNKIINPLNNMHILVQYKSLKLL